MGFQPTNNIQEPVFKDIVGYNGDMKQTQNDVRVHAVCFSIVGQKVNRKWNITWNGGAKTDGPQVSCCLQRKHDELSGTNQKLCIVRNVTCPTW